MDSHAARYSIHEKLNIFRSCFSGLTDVYGTYDSETGRVRQVKENVTDQVLLRHLQGRQPYGVYLLDGDKTRAMVIDFDDHDLNPPIDFFTAAKNYGLATYIEVSKSKGYHVWMFCEEHGVTAAKARIMARLLLQEIDMEGTELFPKQDRLGDHARYGNFINAPLFGALVPMGRAVFLDEKNSFRPHANQWALLDNVERVTEAVLDDILETIDLADLDSSRVSRTAESGPGSGNAFGLPPCAQRMLADGVNAYQRTTCFRLAVHLKKAGIPEDIALAGLEAWAEKNQPDAGKRTITHTEIAQQTHCAYAKSYRACGCEDPAVRPYCHWSCPLRGHRDGSLRNGT